MAPSPFKWMSAGTWTTIATTSLNSLAHAGRVLSSEIDNSSNFYDTIDFELVLASYTPTGVPVVNLYAVLAGTSDTYPDGDGSIAVSPRSYLDFFQVRTGASAKREVIWGLPLPPGKMKIVIENMTNVTWAASGNTLSYKAYNRGVGT